MLLIKFDVIKYWSKMNENEKKKCYNIAIKSGNVKDSYKGFCSMMTNTQYNIKTGKPFEI